MDRSCVKLYRVEEFWRLFALMHLKRFHSQSSASQASISPQFPAFTQPRHAPAESVFSLRNTQKQVSPARCGLYCRQAR